MHAALSPIILKPRWRNSLNLSWVQSHRHFLLSSSDKGHWSDTEAKWQACPSSCSPSSWAEKKPGQLHSTEHHSTEAPRTHLIQTASKTTEPSFEQFRDLKAWVGVSKVICWASSGCLLPPPNPRLTRCSPSTWLGILQQRWHHTTLALLPSCPAVLPGWTTVKLPSLTEPRRKSAPPLPFSAKTFLMSRNVLCDSCLLVMPSIGNYFEVN